MGGVPRALVLDDMMCVGVHWCAWGARCAQVKENDIAKLSFAVELAQEFYGRCVRSWARFDSLASPLMMSSFRAASLESFLVMSWFRVSGFVSMGT